jgi:chromosome partitioning protein
MPFAMPLSEDASLAKASAEEQAAAFEAGFASVATEAQFVLIDTPGSDTGLSRLAHGKADLIITPMNNSFVDFDMLGQVDPVTLELVRPSVFGSGLGSAQAEDAERAPLAGLGGAAQSPRHLRSPEPQAAGGADRRAGQAGRLSHRSGNARPGDLPRLFPFGLTVADLSSTVRRCLCR